MEFPRQWGLGSSSTLTALIAQWAQVSAPWNCPLKPVPAPVTTSLAPGKTAPLSTKAAPLEASHFCSLFLRLPLRRSLEEKSSSARGIERYLERAPFSEHIITQSNHLIAQLLGTANLTQFQQVLTECESFVSRHLNLTPVKERFFDDFAGAIKSLGSWGGDCVLAASSLSPQDTISYFAKRGYNRCIPWREMVCT